MDAEQYNKTISSEENGDGTHASVSELPNEIIHRLIYPGSHINKYLRNISKLIKFLPW